MTNPGGMLFSVAVVLISLLLFGLIVGTLCLKAAGNTSPYVISPTTYWVYGAIAFAIGLVMLLILLWMGYAWSCMCKAKVDPCGKPARRARNSCAPSSCY